MKTNNSKLNIEISSRAAALAFLAASVALCACTGWVGDNVRTALVNRASPDLTQQIIYRLPVVQYLPLAFGAIVVVATFRCKSVEIRFILLGLGAIIHAVYATILLFAFTVPFWIIRGSLGVGVSP